MPGEQPQDKKYIKLNTNESPFPASAGVIQGITQQKIQDLRLYSDPECKALKGELAKVYSHDLGSTLYLIPNNIASYTFNSKYGVDVEMKNGIKLETILRADFERNVLTKLNQENVRQI